MSKLNYPDRIFSVSDCHGGHDIWHPFTSPDVVEQLTQSVRSDLPEVSRFDNFGTSSAYNRYLVKAASRLHEDHLPQRGTGLFINSAPRTEENNNGHPFFRAELDHGLTVVATPLTVLSGVRDKIRKLYRLPNDNNGLYDGSREQHRSSLTPRLLADNHGLDLDEIDPSEIPELPPHCELAYVDRFGNLVISGVGKDIDKIRQAIAENVGGSIAILIGRVRYVGVGRSLSSAKPGATVIYDNDGDVEIVTKWDPKWNHKKRLNRSAWRLFGTDDVGTHVRHCDEHELYRIGGVFGPL